jgi:hypothetical protein
MTFYTKDYGLSALQLELKHAPDGDDEHPGFTKWEWRHEVSHQNTLIGYWEWVKYQLELEEEELSADSPYN